MRIFERPVFNPHRQVRHFMHQRDQKHVWIQIPVHRNPVRRITHGRLVITMLGRALPGDGEVHLVLFQKRADQINRPRRKKFRQPFPQGCLPFLFAVLDCRMFFLRLKCFPLLESAGVHVEFLAVYSSDQNPIEQMWSKVKALLRDFAARTFDQLLEAIATELRSVTPQDAAGWLFHYGYNII